MAISYGNSDISYRDAMRFGDMLPQKIEMIDAIWLVLMYYFDQISPKKVPLYIIKIIIIATHLATLLLSVTPPDKLKKHALL